MRPLPRSGVPPRAHCPREEEPSGWRAARDPLPAPRAPRTCVTLAAAAVLGAGAAAQGDSGFAAGAGRTYVSVAYGRETADEYLLGSHQVPVSGELVRDTVSLGISHGFRDDLDLFVGATWGRSEVDDSLGLPDESGVQDLLAALRWRFLHRRVGRAAVSLWLSPGIETPLADYDTGTITALGDGQTDLRGRVVAQLLLDAGPFVALETGYDVRLGDPSDEVPLHLTVGTTLLGRLTVSPFYSRIDSLGGDSLSSLSGSGRAASHAGSGSGGTGDPTLVEEDVETVGVGVYLRATERLGLTASWRTTVGGSNTADSEGFTLGVVTSWGG